MTATVHDVAILSDFRYPGGNSAAIAAEVRAQAEAGLRTVLVHVPSPHNRDGLPFSPRIAELLRDGSAELATPDAVTQAKLLVIRQPRIFTEDLAVVPRIRAGRTVMVLNQAPGDAADPARYYDFAEVRDRVELYFGPEIEWMPISPQIRQGLSDLSDQDWHEIIDVGEWPNDVPRKRDIPVIGRHGRADLVKWPPTAGELLQAYPDKPDIRVRVLGGGEIATRILGRRPTNWEIIPFGQEEPLAFLRSIDFFVYFHHPDLVEAFGRTILEAMAAGVPAIIGEHFRPIFGDAALYATPAGVEPLVRRLWADPASYRAVAAKAREFVDTRYGVASHLARLADRGAGARPAAHRASGTARHGEPTPRPRPVLMLSDNGAGLGHLSRLMAIGRRLPEQHPAVIATQSYGASVAHREGFLTEYLPSRTVLGLAKQRWAGFLQARLEHLVDLHRPAVVAVDSVPHEGIVAAAAARPDVTWVWVRRPMWRRGTGAEWIARGAAFDRILEPGEFAAAVDRGPTVADRAGVHAVDPIMLLDRADLAAPDEARAALGLEPGRPAALLQLGAGNINDIASPVGRIARQLREAGFQVLLAESMIATEPMPPVPGATVVKVYPISRYLRGLDLVVSASGYNSFHELLAFGVPAVFVPNRETSLDDQVARARFAASSGAALWVEDPDSDELDRVLAEAVRPEVREQLVRRCGEVGFDNGAGAAARWLAELAAETVRRAENVRSGA
ncbi:glycosyl transferase [Actinoplanes sp. SE50]|uniref:glycosyltransferase n=1 Tax=unclassified Actinoplanes TaxID=2626549 RepID=UPI00023EDE4D|nr:MULTISPECIES: glycosyltransferase [unclassified Actinoplanes]AEV88177.1 UDP-N-acetylglucosamine-N-acetylmuramyl- (pentapeptide) pyrophosphoryl-undecaprenol N-acetylglucosamine transferase [Actinoplanes sp. SE50/110]ATO86582.1 glycosyl transferase [Actinoplanes sp. SE50]SLM03999.1 glycosyl transferase [Actinoplanes sp. SE50/110]